MMFLLTENAYFIFECPSTETINPLTQESNYIYNEYNNFAPLSPRLMIVSRSHLVRSESQEIDATRHVLDALLEAVRSHNLHPDQAGSISHSPVRHCIYVQPQITSTAAPDSNDRFCFQYFKIPSSHVIHVTIINNFLLKEACTRSSIVYHLSATLSTSIEKYLEDETLGMKYALSSPFDERHLYLTTVERIARHLGSSTTCRVHHLHPGLRSPLMHMSLIVAARLAVELLQSEVRESSIPQVYYLLKLGISAAIFTSSSSYLQLDVREQTGRPFGTMSIKLVL